MPKRSDRISKRAMSFLSFLIAIAVLAAGGLVCAIVIRDRTPIDVPEAAVVKPGDSFVDVNAMLETEIVLKAPSYSEPVYVKTTLAPGATATPEPTPTPKPTPDDSDPNAKLRPAAANAAMLPIFSKAFTDEKVIAITLDECSGTTITRQFIQMAYEYGAKLTLFPTGENVMRDGMAQVLRQALFELGFEIENRGYSGMSKLYQSIDSVMVQEIWKQSIAVNYVLGVKYQPHFLRLYGGLGENDRRTHAFLKQEGYLGIAHWTYSCTGMKASKLTDKLTPGAIYSFRSTPEDGDLMKALLKAAQREGYRMVTMNELFGYEANRCTQVQGSLLAETVPSFKYDSNALYDIFPGEASWAVFNMQARLAELGYLLPGKVDGIFGEGSAEALRAFQTQVGRPASGAGDVGTLKLLYAIDAPSNPVVLETPTPGPGELWEEGALVPSE